MINKYICEEVDISWLHMVNQFLPGSNDMFFNSIDISIHNIKNEVFHIVTIEILSDLFQTTWPHGHCDSDLYAEMYRKLQEI